KNVLLPAYLPAWERLWPAILSVSSALKSLSLSASAERKRLRPAMSARSAEISPQRFSKVIADDIRAHAGTDEAGAPGFRGDATSLSDSYRLLARLLAEASPA